MSNFKKQLLAGPYLIWMIGFILLPLVFILYYAITAADGSFTFPISPPSPIRCMSSRFFSL